MIVGEILAMSEHQLTEGSLGFRGRETRGETTCVNDVVKKQSENGVAKPALRYCCNCRITVQILSPEELGNRYGCYMSEHFRPKLSLPSVQLLRILEYCRPGKFPP